MKDQKKGYKKVVKKKKSVTRKWVPGRNRKVQGDAYTRMKTLKTQLASSSPPQQMQETQLQKLKKINKPYARKIQILTVGEQRAKVMGKTEVVSHI